MRLLLAGLVTGVVATGLALPSTTAAPRAAGPAPDARVTVATYNICKRNCGTGKFAWDKRRDAIVRSIAASGADVVALQEAAGTVDELSPLLASKGYTLANTWTADCPDTFTRCTSDSFIFYREAAIAMAPLRTPNPPIPERCGPYIGATEPPFIAPEFTQQQPTPPDIDPWDPDSEWLWDQYWAAREAYEQAEQAWREAYRHYSDQANRWWADYKACAEYQNWTPFHETAEDTLGLSQVIDAPWPRAIWDRGWSYAYLRDRRTGRDFLAVSLHLPNEKTAQGEKVRRAGARGVVAFIKSDLAARGIPGLPVVLAGDLNSYARRQPRGAQFILGRAGFRDAYQARRKVHGDAATVNVTTIHKDPFPDRPFTAADPARIDYILVRRGKPSRYEVFLRLRHGRFDDRFRGSDHNMVVAGLRLG